MLELFEEAKKRKIKIIMDFVPNHTSDQCEWFKKSVQSEEHYKDYYIWHNGKVGEFTDEGLPKPPNNWVNLTFSCSELMQKLTFF